MVSKLKQKMLQHLSKTELNKRVLRVLGNHPVGSDP